MLLGRIFFMGLVSHLRKAFDRVKAIRLLWSA